MKYVYEQEPLTAESLEQELGLSKGDIELTIYAEGAVAIDSKQTLTTTQQDKVKAALANRNLPRGKKPQGA